MLAGGPFSRNYTATYDKLGRQTSSAIESDEYGGGKLVRGFSYTHDWSTGRYWRTGPDGVETYVELDEANRVYYMRRGAEENPPNENPLLEAWYHYYANGLLSQVNYGNYTSTWYEYDDAHRLTSIDHRDALGDTMRKLEYGYTDNDLVSGITEHGALGVVAVVSFGYDKRGRLISEVRSDSETPDASYDLAYTYDQGGNRKIKVQTVDALNRIETLYHYDLEAPQTYGSANNRLMWYETYEISSGLLEGDGGPGVGRVHETRREGGGTVGSGDPTYGLLFRDGQSAEQRTLLSTTWYYYNDSGNVTRVVTNEPGTDDYQAVWMVYARNQQALAYAASERWEWDKQNPPTNRQVLWAREFRYDGARQRYLNRVLDPDYLELGGIRPMPGVAPVWSDYDGDEIYGDFTVTPGYPPTVTDVASFELAIGKFAWSGGTPDTTTPQYYHTDMIGTTRFMSDMTGATTDAAAYTAFGEQLDGFNHRYGYGGAWGYQAHEESELLHVGVRYYAPSVSRFLQRDPIGIGGGLNVYAYTRNAPTYRVDPSGLIPPETPPRWDPGWRPPSPPAPPSPPKPPEDPQDELDRIRKRLAVLCFGSTAGGIGAAATCRGFWGLPALACPLAGLIDELVHWGEGVNPVW